MNGYHCGALLRCEVLSAAQQEIALPVCVARPVCALH